MKKTAILNIATEELVRKLHAQHRLEIVIYRKMGNPDLPKLFPDIRWIDCSSDLSENMRSGHAEIRNELESVRKKSPDFFKIDGYDFFEALNREVFWSNFEELLAGYTLSKIKSESEIKLVYDYRKKSWFYYQAKFFQFLFRIISDIFRIRGSAVPNFQAKCKIAIRINSPEIISKLGKLPEILGTANIVYYASASSRFAGELRKLHVIDLTGVPPSNSFSLFKRTFTAKRILKRQHVFSVISQYRSMLAMVARHELLCSKGVKTILLNAGENDGEGNMMAQVARKFGVRSTNFMNGTKAFDAINQYTEFDFWFMHDTSMQRMASEKYQIPAERLPVTGHLLEDDARNYRYSGLLDRFLPADFNGMVIAAFTSPLFFDENQNLYATLQKFIQNRSDVLVFIKPHPRDKEYLWDRKDPRIIRLDFTGEKADNEQILFDMLSLASASVSIASTVSFQASWFSIPSITFELSPFSRLPFTDGIRVKHVNSPELLLTDLESVYHSAKRKNIREQKNVIVDPDYPVAKRIAAFLNHS